MRFNIIVILVVLALQLFLALTPLIPRTAWIWHLEDTVQFHGMLALVFGLEFALITAVLALVLQKEAHDVTTAIRAAGSALASVLPQIKITRLKDYEFYRDFRRAIEDAQHTVRITYLAPYPPTEVASKDRKKYYDAVPDLIRQRANVSFKRIIRASPRNETWVVELITELENRHNIDIAILKDDLPPEVEMPLSLSVQVVDERKAWLVALAGHETERDFRDIYVENDDFAAALTAYYDRIWARCTKVLDRGRITPEGRAMIEKQERAR